MYKGGQFAEVLTKNRMGIYWVKNYKNRRFGSMIDDTYDYLVKVKNRMKWRMYNPHMDSVFRCCNKNAVYNVAAQYLTEKGVKKNASTSSKKTSRSKG